jgi:valacyclovir hydrolase
VFRKPVFFRQHEEFKMSWFEHGTSRIYYEESGQGDPVLLLPGLTGRFEDLSAIREALLAPGYRVITADLPGSGRSGPQPRSYTPSYYQDDARSFAALLSHVGVGPTHLLGFSDGGEVALLIAAMTPGTARSVVAWGAAGKVVDTDGQLLSTLYNVVDAPIPQMKGFRDFLIEAYGEDNARAMTQSVATALRAIVEAGGDISQSRAGDIKCPVLLISGEHDVFAPPAIASQMAVRLSNGEAIMVEGAGHDVHESHSAWLITTMLGWLKAK